MGRYIEIGKKLYRSNTFEDYWRIQVFAIRALIHSKQMKELLQFFAADPQRHRLTAAEICAFEQVSRHWFYHNATCAERLRLIEEHYQFVSSHLTEEALEQIYSGKSIPLWCQEYQNERLSLELCFQDCHKKEGLLALELKIGGRRVYQATFWVAADQNGNPALWIGALQGSPNGLEVNHAVTKLFFGYRPKNFVIHSARVLAQILGINRMFAVSNLGFYTKNHIRLDRKLKISLDSFWQETGGHPCADPRFFALPIVEPRKSLCDVKSHKRNLYKQRFDFLDTVDLTIDKSVKTMLKRQATS